MLLYIYVYNYNFKVVFFAKITVTTVTTLKGQIIFPDFKMN